MFRSDGEHLHCEPIGQLAEVSLASKCAPPLRVRVDRGQLAEIPLAWECGLSMMICSHALQFLAQLHHRST